MQRGSIHTQRGSSYAQGALALHAQVLLCMHVMYGHAWTSLAASQRSKGRGSSYACPSITLDPLKLGLWDRERVEVRPVVLIFREEEDHCSLKYTQGLYLWYIKGHITPAHASSYPFRGYKSVRFHQNSKNFYKDLQLGF